MRGRTTFFLLKRRFFSCNVAAGDPSAASDVALPGSESTLRFVLVGTDLEEEVRLKKGIEMPFRADGIVGVEVVCKMGVEVECEAEAEGTRSEGDCGMGERRGVAASGDVGGRLAIGD